MKSDAQEHLLARGWSSPIAWHLGLLALVLVLVGIVLQPSGELISDEGAAIAQAQALAEDGSWTIVHPLPEADPTGAAFPLDRSTAGGDGEGFAPLAKHPTYPLLLAVQPFGVGGMLAVSAIGTLLAAALGARIARRVDVAFERPALWLLGLGTPLLFYAYVVKAHTLATAAAAGALLLVLRRLDDRTPPRWWCMPAAAVLLAVCTVLRTEGLLYAGAVVVAVLAAAGRRRDPRIGGEAVGLAAVAAVAYVLDGRVATALVSGPNVPGVLGGVQSDGVGDVAGAALRTLFRSGSSSGRNTLLVVVALVCVGVAALVLRRRRAADTGLVVLLLWVGGLAVVLRLLLGATGSELVPGLLAASPMLLAGIVLAFGRLHGPAALCGGVSLVYAAGVLATQYADSGGTQWGGRYLALALPALVPVALVGLRDGARALGPSGLRMAAPAVALLFVGLPVASLLAHHEGSGRVGPLADATLAAAAQSDPGDGGLPVIVATHPSLPRIAWDRLDEARWLLVAPDDLQRLVDRTHDADVAQVVVVAPPGEVLPDEDELTVLVVRTLPSGWTATTIQTS